ELAAGVANLSFREGDGHALPFEERSFDAVVLHTALGHIPAPVGVLGEALRVLRPGGWLAVFDSDPPGFSVAIGASDPPQVCLDAFFLEWVQNYWLSRQLWGLARGAGFEVVRSRTHNYLVTAEVDYALSLIDR